MGAGCIARVLEHDVTQARIDVDGATGVVDLEVLSFDAGRYLVHLSSTARRQMNGSSPRPTEAVTAGGATGYRSTQRQHWTPTSRSGSMQRVAIRFRRGTRHARTRLVIDSDVQSDLTIEMFWAPPWSGTRALISWRFFRGVSYSSPRRLLFVTYSQLRRPGAYVHHHQTRIRDRGLIGILRTRVGAGHAQCHPRFVHLPQARAALFAVLDQTSAADVRGW